MEKRNNSKSGGLRYVKLRRLFFTLSVFISYLSKLDLMQWAAGAISKSVAAYLLSKLKISDFPNH